MDLRVIFVYSFVSSALFLIPNYFWDGINWQLSKDLDVYGSSHWLWKETVHLHTAYKQLRSHEGSKELIYLIPRLVNSLELICELHKDSQREYQKKGLINTLMPPFPTGIGPTEPCDIKIALEDLHDKLISSNLKEEFNNILADYHRTFPTDTYIRLAAKIISKNFRMPAVFVNERDVKNVSEVTKSSTHVLTQLMYHLGMLIHIIDNQGNSAFEELQNVHRGHADSWGKRKLEVKLKSLKSSRKEVPFHVLKIFILLCAHQNFWMSSVYNAATMQFYFAVLNTVLMLIMHFHSQLVFSMIFRLQVLFCRFYKRFVGCPCKFRTFSTFKMLETMIENSRKERRRLARYRHHRNR